MLSFFLEKLSYHVQAEAITFILFFFIAAAAVVLYLLSLVSPKLNELKKMKSNWLTRY